MTNIFILAAIVACVSWTVTKEEIFREWKEFCEKKVATGKTLFRRKIFYPFTCYYCFSHYVTAFFLFLTGQKLMLNDWRGYVLALFATVAIANVYMSIYAIIRQLLKSQTARATIVDKRASRMQ